MGYIAVDLDRTLAHEDGFTDLLTIGTPIPEMVAKVKRAMEEGYEIRIFTARVSHPDSQLTQQITVAIQDWCYQNLGVRFMVTNCKDFNMLEIWDDRCVQVEPNTGEFVGESGLI
jgi:hypothetical protein